ncbi:oxygenase MpaB family protein [Hyphococcus formosus]|uniref:oxygenase MpaB family protein n=1 Tax=Hyphococcus formosus TaxID=3143534 RepID=UPI00398BB25C
MPIETLRSRVKYGLEKRLDKAAQSYLGDPALAKVDFAEPFGEPALTDPNSISWRIFKNPVSLFIGGVTAVILEFAEPRVRTGVWDNTSFRTDPVRRLKRTGLAAMVTVYGAQSVSARMIEMVNRMHGNIAGVTPDGSPYAASDPELLRWVHVTAAFGFFEAYSAYVSPLTDEDRDRYYYEGRKTAALYGAKDAPQSLMAQQALFREMLPKLEASDIIFEFLTIMKRANAFPPPALIAQHSLVRAAIDIVPTEIRAVLGLDKRYGLRPFEGRMVRRMARRADRLKLRSGPPIQACRRMGLPEDYLYPRK